MSSASRGLAPREGLECLLVKMGRTGPLAEPRRGPQAGKSGDPRSQNADILYQIGTRSSLNTSSTCVLCSRLFFHIKSANEIRDGKLLPLMLQQGSKVPP